MGDPAIYDEEFFVDQVAFSAPSAEAVVPLVMAKLPLNSVVDVGCGIGCWASVFHAAGIDTWGIDGDYVERVQLRIPADRFVARDLTQPLNVAQRFDLAVCLETAEHLPPDRAAGFVADLVALAPCVMFSAAVPDQGGNGHLNEQPLSYWVELFSRHGYQPADWLRPQIWQNRAVAWWFRQNTVFFAAPGHTILEGRESVAPDIFHPEFVERLRGRIQYPGTRVCIRQLLTTARRFAGIGG